MPALASRPAPPRTPPTVAERRMLAGIGVFFAVAFVAVAWALTTQVVTQYRMVCDRASAACALTRHHLTGSEETYQVPVPAGARAEVRVTPWRTKAKSRTYLELVAAEERTFLIEYGGDLAGVRASEAATRLNAFLAGQGGPEIEVREGSARSTWATLALVGAVIVGGVAAARAVAARWAVRAPRTAPDPLGLRDDHHST